MTWPICQGSFRKQKSPLRLGKGEQFHKGTETGCGWDIGGEWRIVQYPGATNNGAFTTPRPEGSRECSLNLGEERCGEWASLEELWPSSVAGFSVCLCVFNLGPTDIWGWIILGCRLSCDGRVFSSISVFCLPDANSLLPPGCDNHTCLQTLVNVPWGRNVSPSWGPLI